MSALYFHVNGLSQTLKKFVGLFSLGTCRYFAWLHTQLLAHNQAHNDHKLIEEEQLVLLAFLDERRLELFTLVKTFHEAGVFDDRFNNVLYKLNRRSCEEFFGESRRLNDAPKCVLGLFNYGRIQFILTHIQIWFRRILEMRFIIKRKKKKNNLITLNMRSRNYVQRYFLIYSSVAMEDSLKRVNQFQIKWWNFCLIEIKNELLE